MHEISPKPRYIANMLPIQHTHDPSPFALKYHIMSQNHTHAAHRCAICPNTIPARQTDPNLNYPCQTFHVHAYVQRRRANINSTVYHRSRRHTTCCSSSLRSDPGPEMVMHDRRTINHRFISIRIKKSNTVLCFCGRERKHDASGESGEFKYNILFDRKDSTSC